MLVICSLNHSITIHNIKHTTSMRNHYTIWAEDKDEARKVYEADTKRDIESYFNRLKRYHKEDKTASVTTVNQCTFRVAFRGSYGNAYETDYYIAKTIR